MAVWHANARDARPVLGALGEGYDLLAVEDLRDLSLIGNDRAETLILLNSAAATILCRAMAGGTLPIDALHAWQAQTRAMLALQRRDRRHVRVLDTATALAHPAAFRRAFGLPDGPGPEVPRHNAQDDPLLLTLAQQMLSADPASRALMAELEAVSINLSGAAPKAPLEPNEVFQAYRSRQNTLDEMETLRQRHAELEKTARLKDDRRQAAERALVLLEERNQSQQEELEQLARHNSDLLERADRLEKTAAQLPGLRRRIEEKENIIAAANEMFRQLGAEREALAMDRDRVQANLAATRAEGEDRHARIAVLEGKLEKVYGSRSFRLTRPLRWLRSTFSGRDPA